MAAMEGRGVNTSTTGQSPAAEATEATDVTPRRGGGALVAAAARTARHNPRLVISGALLALCVLIAFVGPLVYTASSTDGDLFSVRAWPSAAHPLGTDSNGRDTLARLLGGMQVTFLVAALVEAINICLGTTVGLRRSRAWPTCYSPSPACSS
jgi:peptide/nickel transport system permease protein